MDSGDIPFQRPHPFDLPAGEGDRPGVELVVGTDVRGIAALK
ncbi:hypothetical protein ACFQFR_03630 [Streptomyces goshikiensis]